MLAGGDRGPPSPHAGGRVPADRPAARGGGGARPATQAQGGGALRRVQAAAGLLGALLAVREEVRAPAISARKHRGGEGFAEMDVAHWCCVSPVCDLIDAGRYHPRNLVGLVPFRAVARWKEAHGITLDPDDRRYLSLPCPHSHLVV